VHLTDADPTQVGEALKFTVVQFERVRAGCDDDDFQTISDGLFLQASDRAGQGLTLIGSNQND